MNNSDKKRFVELLTKTAELYDRELSEFQIELWWDANAHRPIEDIERAIKWHIQDPDRGNWMPKPADISRQLDGPGDSRAFGAWTKVERAIEQHGSWGCLAFDDPAIHAVIEDMGGWSRLCAVTYHELPFKRQEFVKRWLAYLNHPPATYPPVLIGDGGKDFDRPVALIGNHNQARRVMENHNAARVAITHQEV